MVCIFPPQAPAIIDMLLGHVGVFIEDPHGLKDVYNEWYQKTERDFVKVECSLIE